MTPFAIFIALGLVDEGWGGDSIRPMAHDGRNCLGRSGDCHQPWDRSIATEHEVLALSQSSGAWCRENGSCCNPSCLSRRSERCPEKCRQALLQQQISENRNEKIPRHRCRMFSTYRASRLRITASS